MKKRFTHYNLYGEETKTLLPYFVHCETIEYRSSAHNWAIETHLHSQLFQIFLIETGAGCLVLEKTEIPFQAPCILTVPINHLHGFRYDMPTNGRVITLSEMYLDLFLQECPKAFLAINQLLHIPVLGYEERFISLIKIIDNIHKELNDNLSEKQTAIQAYLTLLLIQIFRFTKQNTGGVQNENLVLRYFNDFQKNIKKSLSAMKTVEEYAQELHISKVHLNRICQTVAQKSASKLAEEYILNEAQKLLQETDYPISEIAYRLKFNDPAYFSRLFKKYFLVSPKMFRQN
jgi:AraC family transcriptional regulator, transcriptional activator of pobA